MSPNGEELGFPWGKADSATVNAQKPVAKVELDPKSAPDKPQTFLLEIGTEELPAADLQSALAQLTRASSGDVHRSSPGAW